MGALILAGLVQGAQDAQDVFKGGGGATERRKVKVERAGGWLQRAILVAIGTAVKKNTDH